MRGRFGAVPGGARRCRGRSGAERGGAGGGAGCAPGRAGAGRAVPSAPSRGPRGAAAQLPPGGAGTGGARCCHVSGSGGSGKPECGAAPGSWEEESLAFSRRVCPACGAARVGVGIGLLLPHLPFKLPVAPAYPFSLPQTPACAALSFFSSPPSFSGCTCIPIPSPYLPLLCRTSTFSFTLWCFLLQPHGVYFTPQCWHPSFLSALHRAVSVPLNPLTVSGPKQYSFLQTLWLCPTPHGGCLFLKGLWLCLP